MKLLKILLGITGVAYLTVLPVLLLPWSTISSLFLWFNIQLPFNFPIIIYLFKTVCAVMAVMGVFYVLLARHPFGYGIMLYLAAWGLVFIGLVCLLTGWIYHLPLIVFGSDALFCLLFGIAITVLAYKNKSIN